jgi:hypothetical protein
MFRATRATSIVTTLARGLIFYTRLLFGHVSSANFYFCMRGSEIGSGGLYYRTSRFTEASPVCLS